MKPYKIYFLSAILLLACNREPKFVSKITKINLASGDCFGKCAQAAITVDTSLFYIYFGGKYAVRKGHYEGKVSQAFWDSLRHIIDGIDYKKLDTSNNVADDQSFELVVHKSDQKDRLTFHGSNLPDSVHKAFTKILNSYKNANLHKIPTKHSVYFETRLQEDEPQMPKIPELKFPPPDQRDQ